MMKKILGPAGLWLMLSFSLGVPMASAQVNADEQRTKAVQAVRGDDLVMDGVPNEKAWAAGPWFTNFISAGSDRPDPVQTRFAVRFDDTFLYLVAVADEPRAKGIKHKITDRDGKVYSDDCIEFMIDPTGDRVEYYQFVVNANGALFDAQHRQGGHVMSAEWNADAKAAGQIQEKSFSVELAIPLVQLGLAPHSSSQPWAIQVGRERHATGKLELSSYTQCGGSFHVPSTYAPLSLEGADLHRFLWDVNGPLEGLVTREKGQLTYQLKMLITNGTGRFRFTRVTADLVSGEQKTTQTKSGGNDHGQQRSFLFRLPFAQSGRCSLTITIADQQRPDVPLCVRNEKVMLEYSPLRITIERPFYRDTVYATEDLKKIVASVTLALAEDRLKGMVIKGRLYATALEKGPPIAEVQVMAGTRQARMELPAPSLSIGKHLLVVSANAAGGEMFQAKRIITRAPPSSVEWRIDENLVLRHNGKPFFPNGWFSAPAREGEKLRAEGVTALQTYNSQYYTIEKVREWLDELQAHGLYGCLYPWPGNALMKNFRQPVSPKEETAVRERIRALRDHPALFAYYLWDEPELRPMLVARSDRLYEIIKEEDPYHPCIMLNDTIGGIHEYHNGGDILMPDPYPLFNKTGFAGRPIEYTAKFMLACRDAGKGKKAWWITPQAFDYYYNQRNSRCPNLVELRNQQLQAIIYGARGILWYTYSHRYNYPELDIGMPFVGREALRLRKAILAPELPGLVQWAAEAREHIHAAARIVGQNLFLFSVNTRTAPQDVTFILKNNQVTTLFVVSENRPVKLVGGKFTDHFDSYEGHIYTSDGAAAGGVTVEDTQDAIARAKASLWRKGNLAYVGAGATITVSSKNRYSGRLMMVQDGARKGQGWADGTWRKWPDWLQVTFKEPVTAGRVLVYTTSITDYEVLVEQEGRWRRVAVGKRKEGAPITVAFEPSTISAVRVVSKSSSGTSSSVSEIEVYAE